MDTNRSKLIRPFKLTILSLLISIFLFESKRSCGSIAYGMPKKFFQSFCECGKHSFPIDFLGLGVDLMYHFLIWYALIYLWQDAKETWRMLFVKDKGS